MDHVLEQVLEHTLDYDDGTGLGAGLGICFLGGLVTGLSLISSLINLIASFFFLEVA